MITTPRHHILLLTVAVTAGLGVARPARAGFFDALDKLMKDYSTGLQDQGDKAWATFKAVATDPGEGGSRSEAFNAALDTYAKTFYEDGGLGATMLADLQGLAKGLVESLKAIPAKLKGLWEKLTHGLVGSRAEFDSEVGGAWNDSGDSGSTPSPPEPDFTDTEDSGAVDDGEADEADDTGADGADDAGADDAGADDAGSDDTDDSEASEEEGSAEEEPAIEGEGDEEEVMASRVRASGTSSSPRELFGAYMTFIASALDMRDLIVRDLDEATQNRVLSSFEEVMRHAATMQDQLAATVATAALAGNPSLADLEEEISRHDPELARYAYAGVLSGIRDILRSQGSEPSRGLLVQVEEIQSALAP